MLREWLAMATPWKRPPSEADPMPEVGHRLLGRYQIEGLVGRGGCGMVYRATDRALDLTVAVKVLRSRVAEDAPTTGDLRAEARVAMGLAHPRVVRTFTWDREGSHEFVVMEWVPGGTTLERLKARGEPLTSSEVIAIGVDAAEALAAAHQAGVIHHDVKAQNLLFDDEGRVKVCDFGLAAMSTSESGEVLGTPATISPERIRGEQGDARSDLYSLGATLWHLATGRPPYGAGREAVRGHLEGVLPEAPGLPAELRAVLSRALALEPAARFASAEAFRSALEACAAPVAAVVAKPVRPEPVAAPQIPLPSDMTVVPPRQVIHRGQPISVGSFWLDRLPVTNAGYLRFMEATGAAAPSSWAGNRPAPGTEHHPVTGLTLAGARAFAAWRGRRLPTTAEWLSAAQAAPDGSVLPWGGDSCAGHCVCPREGATGAGPVGARPASRTIDGVEDLFGNVWEFTEPCPEAPPSEPGRVVLAGSSWKHACRNPREQVPLTEVGERAHYDYVGFRCAMDAPPGGEA